MTAPPSLVVLSPEQLRDLIREAVLEAIAPTATQHAPHVVDRSGLAAALGCSIATIDRLRASGLPTVWVADAPRFEVSEVLAHLRSKADG